MISFETILQGVESLAPRRSFAPNRDGGRSTTGQDDVASDTLRRVYVASPITTYQTPRYDLKLTLIAQHFPRAEILQPRDLFHSTADWRRRWPRILPTLTDLVFFAETDRTIGLGVWSELQDAAGCIPVWFLDDDDRWHSLDDITVEVIGEDFSRFASVRVVDRSGMSSTAHRASPKGGA